MYVNLPVQISVHSQGRSSLMLVLLFGANRVKDFDADTIQGSKGVSARTQIATLFPVRGADLTQSSPAGAVELGS